jgi:mono/diheme cytochrome c family protein
MVRGFWTAALALAGLELVLAGSVAAQETKPSTGSGSAQQAQAPADEPKKNPFTGDSAAIAEGRQLYMKYNCYGCHGTAGGGGMGSSLIDSNWAFGGDDASVFNSIQNGAGRMPPLGQMANIPDEEIWKMVAFIRSLYKGDPDKIVW